MVDGDNRRREVAFLCTTVCSPAALNRSSMREESEPTAQEIALAGIAAIVQIDDSDEADDASLVAAFLCAAWPSTQAQSQ